MTTDQPPSLEDTAPSFKLRRCILLTLYEVFKALPYASTELRDLGADCRAEPTDLNWNLVYLEKAGLIELDKSSDCAPYVSCSLSITASGVDLVENPDEFNRRFPVKNYGSSPNLSE